MSLELKFVLSHFRPMSHLRDIIFWQFIGTLFSYTRMTKQPRITILHSGNVPLLSDMCPILGTPTNSTTPTYVKKLSGNTLKLSVELTHSSAICNSLCPTFGPCPAKRMDRSASKSIALVSSYKGSYPVSIIAIGQYLPLHAITKTRLLNYLINQLTNRHQTRYDTMPYITEHIPKVSSRSVDPYARESSRQKRQTGGQTDTRIGQNHFSRRFDGCISQIRSYLKLDFLHDNKTSRDMKVKHDYLGFHGGVNFVAFVSPRCSFLSISLKILEVWDLSTIIF